MCRPKEFDLNIPHSLCYRLLLEMESNMEIFGGFMVMMSIIGFFLAVVWLVMPFVVLNVKGKIDRAVDQLTEIDRRLNAIEAGLARMETAAASQTAAPDSEEPADTLPLV